MTCGIYLINSDFDTAHLKLPVPTGAVVTLLGWLLVCLHLTHGCLACHTGIMATKKDLKGSKSDANIQDIINGPASAVRSSRSDMRSSRNKIPHHTAHKSPTKSPPKSVFGSPGDIGTPKPQLASSNSPPDKDKSFLSPGAMIQETSCQNLTFEFNPIMIPIDPLIAPCNRGDSAAISDAINQMYSTMVVGQNKLEAYIAFNDKRYKSLACKVDSYAVKVDNFSSLARDNKSNISSLETKKVDHSHFAALQKKVDQLESHNSNRRSKIESLESEQAASLQNLSR